MQPGAVSAALLTPQSAPFISPLFKRGITTPLPVRFTPEETLQEIFPFPGSPSRQIVRLIKHFFPPVGRKEWGERMGEGNKRRVGGGGGAKKIPSNELPRHHDPIKSQHRLSPRFTGPKHRPSGLPSLPPLSFPPSLHTSHPSPSSSSPQRQSRLRRPPAGKWRRVRLGWTEIVTVIRHNSTSRFPTPWSAGDEPAHTATSTAVPTGLRHTSPRDIFVPALPRPPPPLFHSPPPPYPFLPSFL